MATERRERWDELRAALQAFVDAIPNDDLPPVFHALIVIEDKETQETLRYYPLRMSCTVRNPAAASLPAAPEGEGMGEET